MSLDRTIDVPEGGVHVVGDAAPVLHAARVHGLHPVLAGAEPPVAAGLEEVGVVVGVVAPAQRRLDPGHRQTQTPDGLRPSDLHLGIEHPVVLTCPEREREREWYVVRLISRSICSQSEGETSLLLCQTNKFLLVIIKFRQISFSLNIRAP